MVEFGHKLRVLRKQHNLTQKELASMIGVKNSVISFYEVGERLPSPEIIRKIAETLHISSDYLLGIEKQETVDISGLSEHDKSLVCSLVHSLRKEKEE